MRGVHLLVLLLPLSCLDVLDPLDPEVGPPVQARCVDEDSDSKTEVLFSRDLLPLFWAQNAQEPGCSCHQPTSPSPIGLEQSGLDLSSYASLRQGGIRSRATIIVEGSPCSSVLWQKASPAPPFGGRMPFDAPPFVSPAARQALADWIAEGARDN